MHTCWSRGRSGATVKNIRQMPGIIEWRVSALQDDCAHLEIPIKAVLLSEMFHFIKMKKPQERILFYKYFCVICLMRKYSSLVPDAGTRKLYIHPVLHPKGETKIKIKQTGFNLIMCFCHCFLNTVFYKVMKTLIDIQMLAFSRWYCHKMQDMLLVCQLSLRVFGAFKHVLWFTFTLAAINISKSNFLKNRSLDHF